MQYKDDAWLLTVILMLLMCLLFEFIQLSRNRRSETMLHVLGTEVKFFLIKYR